MLNLTWLEDDDISFPPLELALEEPNGLLAAGGDLSPERLIYAYSQGIFPWYEEGQPPLWWSPSPRLILLPEELHIPRSLAKTLRKGIFRFSADTAFEEVIRACAEPRDDGMGTWITEDMIEAYCQLHQLGFAHSVETWLDGELVGGFYGIQLGQAFFGESMFARYSDASKAAFVIGVEHLESQGCRLIDCQITTEHLVRFGAKEIDRGQFRELLIDCIKELSATRTWHIQDC
ncbi:leucyl/phenylalanyl-tRNA--protein transferase [Maricurvus nonylphenolicus]|uniref:leucyl/phenylalanyl-tRNA--protein transferase n=1 Tax=Maricurvus nonylphenolicus TaxID=1008307 RepID=UPI0036F3D2FA